MVLKYNVHRCAQGLRRLYDSFHRHSYGYSTRSQSNNQHVGNSSSEPSWLFENMKIWSSGTKSLQLSLTSASLRPRASSRHRAPSQKRSGAVNVWGQKRGTSAPRDPVCSQPTWRRLWQTLGQWWERESLENQQQHPELLSRFGTEPFAAPGSRTQRDLLMMPRLFCLPPPWIHFTQVRTNKRRHRTRDYLPTLDR